MKRTLLATLLVVTLMLLTGRVLAHTTGEPHDEPTVTKEERKVIKDERKAAKVEQKESRAALKAEFKEAQKEATTNPELRPEMLAAAKKYLAAFGDNLLAQIDRLVTKLPNITLLSEAQITSFTGDLQAVKLEVASVQASANAVTTLEELKAVRADMRTTFTEFKTILKDLRAAIKTAKETAKETKKTPE